MSGPFDRLSAALADRYLKPELAAGRFLQKITTTTVALQPWHRTWNGRRPLAEPRQRQ